MVLEQETNPAWGYQGPSVRFSSAPHYDTVISGLTKITRVQPWGRSGRRCWERRELSPSSPWSALSRRQHSPQALVGAMQHHPNCRKRSCWAVPDGCSLSLPQPCTGPQAGLTPKQGLHEAPNLGSMFQPMPPSLPTHTLVC